MLTLWIPCLQVFVLDFQRLPVWLSLYMVIHNLCDACVRSILNARKAACLLKNIQHHLVKFENTWTFQRGINTYLPMSECLKSVLYKFSSNIGNFKLVDEILLKQTFPLLFRIFKYHIYIRLYMAFLNIMFIFWL